MLRATCRSMLALALLSWCGCKHTCDDTPSAVIEFFEPIEQPQTRSLGWAGLVETGELDESQAWTSVTVEVILANDSARADDANPAIGCDAHFTIDGTMLITSDDGLLDESIPLELEGDPETGSIFGFADLTGYDFAGTLELGPEWSSGELWLHVAFDGAGSLDFGWLIAQRHWAPDDQQFIGGGILAVIDP